MPDPVADLLADLDPAQREAALATTGPVCILAGAGTGKTRAISHRVAHAVASGTVAPQHVLVVTFTDKAAGEMRERLAALGRPGIAASTFHAAALRQLRHFWPRVSGADLPAVLETKVPMLVDLARGLPGGYRYVAVRDLAGRDRVGEGPAGLAGRLRGGGPGHRPRRSPPGAPLRAALPALRGGQGAGRPDRLRGHARDDRPAPRGRAGDRRRGPGPLPLVQRRRVPGHERPPAGAPRRLARRTRGPGRRRRRGPDDLHVHRGVVGVADRVHGALSRRRG